ncbi:MAG: hypothetical protein HC896_09640 [Bacteroidales bacterium]|nr:hypothetical protein [Bacteroidales bacterium]
MSVEKRPKNYDISRVVFGDNNELIYQYKPASGFTGVDSACIDVTIYKMLGNVDVKSYTMVFYVTNTKLMANFINSVNQKNVQYNQP